MKTIFLSFDAAWYEPLRDGRKKYEHRKRFGGEPVRAFLYLGKPYQKIVAEIEMDRRELLLEWLNIYSDYPEVTNRILDFIKRNKYVMKILSFKEIKSIDIGLLMEDCKDFHIPRSYIYLENKPEVLAWIERNKSYTGYEYTNDFSTMCMDDICSF